MFPSSRLQLSIMGLVRLYGSTPNNLNKSSHDDGNICHTTSLPAPMTNVSAQLEGGSRNVQDLPEEWNEDTQTPTCAGTTGGDPAPPHTPPSTTKRGGRASSTSSVAAAAHSGQPRDGGGGTQRAPRQVWAMRSIWLCSAAKSWKLGCDGEKGR